MDHHRITLDHGHLLAELDGRRWVVDTGCPITFGTVDRVALFGDRISVQTSALGLNAAALSDFIGVPVAGLLGSDAINRFDILFDLAAGRMTRVQAGTSVPGHRMPIELALGVPKLTVEVQSRPIMVVFDTGAQIGYFTREIVERGGNPGEFTDFFVGIGRFTTRVADVPIRIGPVACLHRAGEPPDPVWQLVRSLGAEGILGNRVLIDQPVLLAPSTRTLTLVA